MSNPRPIRAAVHIDRPAGTAAVCPEHGGRRSGRYRYRRPRTWA